MKRILIFLMLIIASPLLAADYYVDPSAGSDGVGTFADPYNTWSGKTISTGNDYRQKCGTTYSGTLTITANGASDNTILIGAYYDDSGAVHEDDNPSYGQTCGNSAQKPIIQGTYDVSSLITTNNSNTSQYLEINSLQLVNGEYGVKNYANNNTIQYCYMYNISEFGIRAGTGSGGHYMTAKYNHIDMNDPADEGVQNGDGIWLNVNADNAIVKYNAITSFDHGGVMIYEADNGIIENNYIYKDHGYEDFCIGMNLDGDSHTVRYNYCQDAGMGIMIKTGNNNIVSYNILTCNGANEPDIGAGCLQLGFQSGYSNNNNKIYNNTIYDNDDQSNTRGIHFYNTGGTSMTGNEVYNNIIQKVDGDCIRTYDVDANVDNNLFKNNACYDYGINEYADIEGTAYADAAAFNVRSDATGNIDTDPQMNDPVNDNFTLQKTSPCINTGIDNGLSYNNGWDPASSMPPNIVSTLNQNDYDEWEIGAYIQTRVYTVCASGCDYSTIAAVNAASFSNNSVIEFERGETFNDTTLTLNSTSASTSGITIQARGAGDKPRLDGNSYQPIFIDHALINLTIKDLDVSGSDGGNDEDDRVEISNVNGLVIDGVDYNGHTGSSSYKRVGAISVKWVDGNIEIKNCTIQNVMKDTFANTKTAWGSNDANGILFWYGNDVKLSGAVNVYDNTITDVYSDSITVAGIQTAANVYNNTLDGYGENGIDLKHSRYIEVYENSITSGNIGVSDGVGGLTNTGVSAGSSASFPGYYHDDNTIRNNYFYDSEGGAVAVAGERWKVYHNYFKDVGQAVAVGNADGSEIHNNIISMTSAPDSDYVLTELSAIYFPPRTYTSLYLYNNTIYMSHANHLYGIGYRPDSGMTGVVIRNNIIQMTQSGSNFPIYIQNDTGDYPTVEYNNLYNSNNTNRIYWKGVEYNSTQQTDWINAGHPGELFENPDMNSPANGNFTLQSDSPCINNGYILGGSYDDGWNPVSSMPPNTISTLDQDDYDDWEIGAYIYAEETPYTTPYDSFIKTFTMRIGGTALSSGDEATIANFSAGMFERFHYNDIAGDSWTAIKNINSSFEAYLYQDGTSVYDNEQSTSAEFITTISRYDDSGTYGDRGHTMGDLYVDNEGLFLHDSGASHINRTGSSTRWMMDVGDANFQYYWSEATINDIVCSNWSSSSKTACTTAQSWVADGVFIDNMRPDRNLMAATPTEYATDLLWSTAVNSFLNSIQYDLEQQTQKVVTNRNGEYTQANYDAWETLDNTSHPPDVVLDEGAFAVEWGTGDVQFLTPAQWLMQVDTYKNINNSDVWLLSHTDLTAGQSGTDNYSQSVSFWDILWYTMGSYHIAKNATDNNTYFGFDEGNYSTLDWYDEYDNIDLGVAVSDYYTKTVDGETLYLRNFEYGYVIVNPQTTDLTNVSYADDLDLPSPLREITHANMATSPLTSIATSTSFSTFKAHRAKILWRPQTSHYVDTTAAGGGDGTWGNPFKTIAEVNAHSFSEGEDVYFKVGQTWSRESLTIDWSGTSSDHVVVGAWEAFGDFTLEGDEQRPIIDGENVSPSNSADTLVKTGNGETYIDIQDLNVKNSNGNGISATLNSSIIRVQRCKVENSDRVGILFWYSDGGFIEYNEVLNSSLENPLGTEPWYQSVTSSRSSGTFIRYNYLNGGRGEGIGIGDYNTVKYNLVTNIATVNYYLNAVSDSTVAYNLAVGTSDPTYHHPGYGGWHGPGIAVGVEPQKTADSSRHMIHHNVVINTYAGLRMYVSNPTYEVNNIFFYHNTLIDNDYSFKISNQSDKADNNIFIYNNISYPKSADSSHVIVWSETLDNWDCDYNVWAVDSAPTGVWAGGNDQSGDPNFPKTTWRNGTFNLNSFTTDDFIADTGSATDNGADLGEHYDEGIASGSDMVTNDPINDPIIVNTLDRDAYTRDIGATVKSNILSFYFSDDAAGNPAGTDVGIGSCDQSGVDCTIGSPCKTLAQAQDCVNNALTTDTVYLYFDKGDTWSMDTAEVQPSVVTFGVNVGVNDPIVHIDAYGSGDRPVFDGLVTDFSAVPDHSLTNGPKFWNHIFRFEKFHCSVQNIEIKRVYGCGIFMDNADYFTLSDSSIHDFGVGGIQTADLSNARYITVERNTFHTGQQLWRFRKRSGWGSAIQLLAEHNAPIGNLVRHNLVYDIYGEGINASNGTVEYNIVGDTTSIAINTAPHAWDTGESIVRYNLIIHSDWSTSVYDSGTGGEEPTGIRVFDEHVEGDNTTGSFEIYGNIVINRGSGIKFYSGNASGGGHGLVKIYNNLLIDNHYWNIRVSDVDGTPNATDVCSGTCYIYNNASIYYDTPNTTLHMSDNGILPHANFIIENNAYWTTGGSPEVDGEWDTDYITTNPMLPGEPSIDWDGLASSPTEYWNLVDIATHLYPSVGSALINSGKQLGVGFDSNFLTTGSDFDTIPDTNTFVLEDQDLHSSWEIGPLVVPAPVISEYYVDDSCTDTYQASATVDGTTYDPVTPACTGGTGAYYVTIADVNQKDFLNGDIISFNKGDTFDDADLTLTNLTATGAKTLFITSHGSGELPWINERISINKDGLNLTIKNIKIDGQEYTDDYPKIYLQNLNNVTIDGVTGDGSVGWISKHRAAIAITNSTGDVEVKNINIKNWGGGSELWADPATPTGTGIDSYGLAVFTKNSGLLSIHDNTISNVESDCIILENIRGDPVSIYNNTLWNGGENSVDIKGSDNVTVYKNTMGRDSTFIGTGGSSTSEGHPSEQGVVQVLSTSQTSESENIIIRNNLIGPTSNANFRMGTDGVSTIDNNNVDVYNNYFKDAWAHVVIKSYNDDVKIFNNVFDGLKTNGRFIWDRVRFGTISEYPAFYNNTFYSGSDQGSATHEGTAGLVFIGYSDGTYKNNIFHVNDSNQVIVHTDSNALPTLTNNLFYNANAGDDTIIDWADTYYDEGQLSTWIAAGHTGAKFQNPVLNNPANDDMSLNALSPAINAGTTIGSTWDDGWNSTTPLPPSDVTTLDQDSYGSAWEMGTYVYSGDQTYYVTQNGGGNGQSIGSPWSWANFLSSGNWSTQDDQNKIDPGDTVCLSGTIDLGTTSSDIPGSGTAGNYIKIDGACDGVAAAVLTADYLTQVEVITIHNKSYLELSGFTFNGHCYRPFHIEGSSYLKFHDITLEAIVTKHGMSLRGETNNVEIYDSSFIQQVVNLAETDGIYTVDAHDIKIHNNYFSNWTHTAVLNGNNKFHANYPTEGQTYNIEIYENYFDLPLTGYGRAFSTWSWDLPGLTHHVYFHHNYINGVRTQSQTLSGAYLYIYNNIFYDTKNCCELATDAGCSESYIECDYKDWWKTGRHLSIQSNYGVAEYIWIYNNLFHTSSESSFALSASPGNVSNIYIKNNIFYQGSLLSDPSDDPPGSTSTSGDYTLHFKEAGGGDIVEATLEFENNIIFTTGETDILSYEDTPYTVAELNALSWASGNIQLDPEIFDAANGNFTLLPDSPAIDAGLDLGEIDPSAALKQYSEAFQVTSDLPPDSVTTVQQDLYGSSWEIGPYVYNLPIVPGLKGFGVDTRAAYGATNPPLICVVNDIGAGNTYTNLTRSTRNGVDVLEGTFGECIYFPNNAGATVDTLVVPANSGKIIIFEKSGTINGPAENKFNYYERNDYVSIVGQTAPSPGVTLRGIQLALQGHDILLQHLRFRLGDEIKPGEEANAAWHENRDALVVADYDRDVYNVVVDHVSTSWSMDEVLSIWEDTYDIYDVTIANSIISEGLHNSQRCDVAQDCGPAGGHSKGLLVGQSGAQSQENISFLFNLLAHNDGRNPAIYDGEAYVANNLIYNPGDASISARGQATIMEVSTIGNVGIKGINSNGYNRYVVTIASNYWAPWIDGGVGSKLYAEDNLSECSLNSICVGLDDPCRCCTGAGTGTCETDEWAEVDDRTDLESVIRTSTVQHPPPGFVPLSSSVVKDYVLTNAGARPADRDQVDIDVITETSNESGGTIVDCVATCDSGDRDAGDWPTLAVNTDTHNDIPASPHVVQNSGYTAMEEWVHAFSETYTPTPHDPYPADGATGIPLNVIATWTNAESATSIDLYWNVGVNPPTTKVLDDQNVEDYNPPADLSHGVTVYWQVVTNHAEGTTDGPIWSFSTPTSPEETPDVPGTLYNRYGNVGTYDENGMLIK